MRITSSQIRLAKARIFRFKSTFKVPINLLARSPTKTGKLGRPPGKRVDFTVKFKIPLKQAEYLQMLASKYGWGHSIHDVASGIVGDEIRRLQKKGFHNTVIPFDLVPEKDSGPERTETGKLI